MWEQRFIQSIVVQFDYFRFFRWEIIGGQAWRERVFRVRAVCFYQVSSNSWRVVVSGQQLAGSIGLEREVVCFFSRFFGRVLMGMLVWRIFLECVIFLKLVVVVVRSQQFIYFFLEGGYFVCFVLYQLISQQSLWYRRRGFQGYCFQVIVDFLENVYFICFQEK